jgi:chemotaxis protein CheC
MRTRSVSAEELDILRELSNIGAGHAVTSLSSLLGKRRVSLRVPRVEAVPIGRLGTLVGFPESAAIGIALGLHGALRGDVLVLFRHSDALQVAALITGRLNEPFTDLDRSALEEMGNILASSYLNALSRMVGGPLLPTTPTLHSHDAATVIVSALGPRAAREGEALVLVNEFVVEGVEFVGHFLLFLEPESLEACLEAAQSWS